MKELLEPCNLNYNIMAEFSLDGRMTVRGLKENFKKCFGATLRVYTTPACKTYADEKAT